MVLPGSYANGFAPRDGRPLYSELWRGCVGAWAPCLGPTGLTLRDWSGLANHGTLNGGPSFVVSQGRYGIDFNGTSHSVDFAPTTATTVHTVCAWVFNRDIGDAIIIGGGVDIYALYTDTNSSGGSVYYAASSGNFKGVVHGGMASTWTHLAVVRNGTSLKFYKNGVLLGSQTLVTNTATSFRYIGREGGGFYANMQFDDAVIVNREMSQNEIALRARRRGIAYELAPRRRSVLVAGFRAHWARRRALVIGGGID